MILASKFTLWYENSDTSFLLIFGGYCQGESIFALMPELLVGSIHYATLNHIGSKALLPPRYEGSCMVYRFTKYIKNYTNKKLKHTHTHTHVKYTYPFGLKKMKSSL